MSTTMISNDNRRFVTPVGVVPPNKRPQDGPKPPFNKKIARPIISNPGPIAPNPTAQNNHLLAGYLAHEFLSKGTLFGEPWDPARAEACPVSADSRREKGVNRAKPSKEKHESYVAVSDLLKADGVQLSCVVNPTQLASFLQL